MNTSYSSLPLWDFALAFYAQPGVAEICVELQDEYQANVCLLIGLYWLDLRNQFLDDAKFLELQTHIQPWTQDVIAPLRSVRRLLKLSVANMPQDEAQEQLRAAIKQAELLAEKTLLLEISRWANTLPPQHRLQEGNNLERYCASLGALPSFCETLQIAQ